MTLHIAITLILSGMLATACSNPPSRTKSFGREGVILDPNSKPVPGEGDEASNPNPTAALFATAFPRLSHTQYLNSVRDLLLLKAAPTGIILLPDPQGSVFQNDGKNEVTSDLRINYEEAADQMGAKIASDAALMKLLVPATASGAARAEAIVEPLARRAYRRAPTTAELRVLVNLFNSAPKIYADATANGIQAVISTLMQSPYFIYRIELGTVQEGDFLRLSAIEVASRLSYGAWNSGPDDELLAAAISGSLLKPDVLKAQAARLLKDPRAADSLDYFHLKGFGAEDYRNIPKDTKLIPDWANIGDAPYNEAKAFVHDVAVVQGKGLTELMTAPYTFANAASAPLYGVKSVSGTEMTKITLDPTQRAGFFTQIGYLAKNASLSDSLLIRRGAHLVEKFLCPDVVLAPPPLPPGPEKEGKTQRERMNAKTGPGTCGSACHTNMLNPPGFALESFDAVGRWRTMELNGAPIDPSGSFSFGKSTVEFTGAVEFIKGLVKHPEIHRCYVKHAIEYLYARKVTSSDASIIEDLTTKSMSGMATRDIFTALLSDPNLVTRRPNKETP